MKQVIVIRSDLKLSRGKACVQVAHASLVSALKVQKKNEKLFKKWLLDGQKKVVLKVRGEKELLEIYEKARENDLVCEVIRDAGLTELEPGTITCIGIGPDEEKKIDKITGSLPLLK
ncbi:MAG: peptidyl-tRNA hydrolase Pth2 [Candidatus Parvarchaeota archaeon]|nr:peptidyl-tRNA hydrolase Pth2 [Candidatus Jingweiarchaeum tengchongense]MCW1297834.1 peptidyl-tRNA hydrolase Pth2 [Candidatus Jingweiarchaeum tengchongense]MCW1299845.1 peptidyl-tRNA hydrolase Pth2 [Candidatus Jingweiarchaeum tengchongense]MCW1304185.1 peptidyl-tRNA hydrolase Pth2 [Candidatus Jingweiarchaeum tengchongense]MCW1305213.1 peptidyl-tRNA hydrolase Pth2 [Candidatus Jingweiarchaeum tengchongense]